MTATFEIVTPIPFSQRGIELTDTFDFVDPASELS